MAKKKKKVDAKSAGKSKYASKVDERIKKINSIEAEGDQALWKSNEDKLDMFMRRGRIKHKDKLPPKVASKMAKK